MEKLVTSYSTTMVAISFLISMVGAFIALNAARNMVRADGSLHRMNTFTASLALGGIAVWAMHFVGMLALRLPMGHGYSMVETGLSLVAAAAATGAALVFVARNPGSRVRLLVAGVLLGLAVCVMHYLGMQGMRFGGYFLWSVPLVLASIAIAIVAATAALWLAFNTRGLPGTTLASMVMAVAVCAMHYTGMGAADFICTVDNRSAVPTGFGVISSWELPSMVIFSVACFAVVLAADQLFNALSEAPRAATKPAASN
ncbi:MAG: histidine kinase [Burkholderiaceae bacterium]|nr:histidine kinase [Burkholderiaceae bacterium]